MKLRLKQSSLTWINDALARLTNFVDVAEDGAAICFAERADRTIIVRFDGATLSVNCDKRYFFRALGTAIKNAGKSSYCVQEKAAFQSLTYMQDYSRNAVLKYETFCDLATKLALLGYDSMQLYIEDVIELPDEPYFGHLRARLTVEEIQKMDAFAAGIGIELIPAVQSLAHYDHIFLWPEYNGVKDLANILLIGEDKTYALLDKLFATLSRAFRTKKINIGFDEAHLVCFGNYVHKNGLPKDRTKVVMAHLERVLGIVKKYGFDASIWSDMFFRLAYKGAYYPDASESNRPLATTKKLIPADLTLIYWDYYHQNKSDYDLMFRRHKVLGRKISFAGGAWKWLGFAPHNAYGISCLIPALAAAKRNKIDNFILTAWGDDGAEAPTMSTLPQIATVAECAFRTKYSLNAVKKACCTILGANYDDFLMLDAPNRTAVDEEEGSPCNPGKYLLYNDPLHGLFDAHITKELIAHYNNAHSAISACKARNKDYAHIFDMVGCLTRYLGLKLGLTHELRCAYEKQDKGALKALIDGPWKEAMAALDDFLDAVRTCWCKENQVFGLDNLQLRLGGQKQRLAEVAVRINQYLSGEIDRIAEFDAPVLPIVPGTEGQDIYRHAHSTMATPSYYLTRT